MLLLPRCLPEFASTYPKCGNALFASGPATFQHAATRAEKASAAGKLVHELLLVRGRRNFPSPGSARW